jgi:hypothetical protein
MTAITSIQPQFVECIPEQLEPGVLYISRRFSTATHLCCSGCGSEVVTPLNPAKWRLTERGGKVSVAPSIGNWSLPCQSHYWITDNQVRFASAMSPAMIAGVKARDRRDAQMLAPEREGWVQRAARHLTETWDTFKERAGRWWR